VQGIFSNHSAICTKWGSQTFLQIFGIFAIYDLNFMKIVAPLSNENKNSLVLLKGRSFTKKW